MKTRTNISWIQAILISCIACAASVLLCVGMRPQSLPGALLFLLSPLPLIIAGLSYNALVAALAALIGCLALSFVQNPALPLMYGLVAGLPSWLICAGAANYQNKDSKITPGHVVFGIACYVCILIISATAIIVPDHSNLANYLSEMIKESFKIQGETNTLSNFDEKDANVISIFARVLPHMSAISFFVMLVSSSYLGAKIALMSSLLRQDWLDFRVLKMPVLAFISILIALPLNLAPGYIGLGGEIFILLLSLCFMLQGLAVLHFKVAKSIYWRWLILVSWSAIIIFGFIGLGFTLIGLADFIFDFRKLRRSSTTSPNQLEL